MNDKGSIIKPASRDLYPGCTCKTPVNVFKDFLQLASFFRAQFSIGNTEDKAQYNGEAKH
jgi:hypothetical protein